MEFDTVLQRRYSCRAFSPNPVEQEKVDRILEAGRMAHPCCWSLVAALPTPGSAATTARTAPRSMLPSSPPI